MVQAAAASLAAGITLDEASQGFLRMLAQLLSLFSTPPHPVTQAASASFTGSVAVQRASLKSLTCPVTVPALLPAGCSCQPGSRHCA
jgi:hypothetical protein